MLIDASNCCDHHVNEAVDDLFTKAATDPPDIWREHESPLVRRIIELFTQRGMTRIGSLQFELQQWMDGQMYQPGNRPLPLPPGFLPRWTDGELSLVRLYLETLPPAEFTIDDWMLCLDWLHERYFPPGQMWNEAEWLAVKSSMMGRIQARMGEISLQQADKLLAASPATVPAIAEKFGITSAQKAILTYGRTRCAENIKTMADGLRRRLKSSIMEYQKGVALGDTTIRESLQTRIGDAFGQANVDFRRIAITEAGEMQTQGLIASLKPGTRVRRLEQYIGACPFCRKIDGMEFDVVDPSEAADGWTQVWPGKTNIGRSAAKSKRVAGELVDREDHELWWPASGVQHPNCRGTWLTLNEPDSAGDDDFTAWAKATLEKSK